MIQRHHDDPAQNYPGISKTTELFSRNYYFPEIRKKIERYISKYSDYQQNKYSTHAFYGHIQFAEIIEYFWQKITMDFIVKLSKSENHTTGVSYNNILVIIDKLTKYLYLIPYKKISNIK